MPPLPGSPAIDASSDAATNTFATDQRGYPRLEGSHVDIGAVELPTIQFTASPTNDWIPTPVQFTCPSADSDGSTIRQWNWNFNDTTSTVQSPAHIYSTAGSFSPGLIVTNNLGLTLAAFGPSIFVSPPLAIKAISQSKTNLMITGSNGVSSVTYYVLTTTNLALPRSQWTPVATNIWNANGNFSLTVTNAVNSSVPKRFYILQVQ
jgi:PKD repeat protein